MPSPSSNFFRVALLALILCAFGLRVYKLDAQSLWYDEGVTAIVAQYDLPSLAQWTADDIQPPLYYALVSGWGRLAGWGEWSLRFPSVFFGLLILPLLAALTIRWNGSRLAGALTALLAAFHPLLLYYSQEARMYSLLVALGVGIAYCVVDSGYGEGDTPAATGQKSGDAKSFQVILWGVYAALATAALYTHYFAIFLLVAVNGAYLLDLLRSSRFLRHTSPNPQFPIPSPRFWLLANAVVFLLFTPWLGNLLTRLDVDTSYWEGAFKLWEALTAIAIRFTSGETVLEGQATRLLWMYGAVTLLALFGLVADGKRKVAKDAETIAHSAFRILRFALSTLQYPLLLLLIPIAGVLALAAFTPKFNARYVMVALPGLLMIWSAGLAGLLRAFIPVWQRLQRVACNTQPRALPAIAGLVGTGLLLAGFIQADRNWFTDNAFTKDQWRELAAYVQGQMGENDAVVLVSGHTWPVWRYYAQSIEPVRLPDIEILDVNAVVDLDNSTAILRPALLGKDAAWLVDWQAQVIDPTDVAGLQLARAGVEHPLDAQFWGLDLRRYTELDARAISNAPPIQRPFRANFGDAVELLGYSVEPSGDLLLFWRLTHPAQPLPDLYLTGETRTEAGLLFSRLGDRRLSAYDFPTFRWQIGQIVAGRIPMEEWIGAGAPAGNYQLRLGVYDPAGDSAGFDLLGPQGDRQGKRVSVEVALDEPIAMPADEDPTTWHPLVDGLFVRPILVNSSAGPGQSFLLQILWFSQTSRRVGGLVVHWNEQEGTVQHDGQRVAVDLALPAGQPIRTVHQISVPIDLPPGEYWLELTSESGPTRPVELPVTVVANERQFHLPALAPALTASFDGQIVLAGLTESEVPAQVAPGFVLPLTFVWQSSADIATDYTVSVQWLDADGRAVGQADEALPHRSSSWLPNEVVSQIIKLAAPAQPGEYRLIVALYDANRNGLPRLHLPDGTDFVEVARVRVVSPAQP
ncbi:MAG: glycosyltransferase family 39 protein [Caldilineaceae bacterium]